MKKKIDVDHDEMPAEFDFSNAIPNPWFVAVHGAKFVRVIDQDLADRFPDNASMNAALRKIAEVVPDFAPQPRKISARRVTAPKAARKK